MNGKPGIIKSVSSPVKRSFEDDFDGENVDPAMFDSPSKKTKSESFDKQVKPFTFSLTPQKSMPPPSTIPSRLSTPIRANPSSPRAPLTAPAGRSPKRKIAGIGKNRRVSAPFSRIDPPGGRVASTLPFSLDAALSGTLSSEPKVAAGATIQESMPKSWFFDIYEDTPEEEAANLMEHSTLTLDLSSDDEDVQKEKSHRGKENEPPEGYDAPTASQPAPKHIKKTEIVRKKLIIDEMDDGERSPLSDLETETFIPEGLDKDSHVVVDEVQKSDVKAEIKPDVNELFAAPAPVESTAGEKKTSSVVVDGKGDVKGEIIVWEDSDV